ncbi:hypothetical protein HYFRA_00010310 [Hymenoscyphus fraxineus]|uniref:Uncharacterized protein n=1 Tax=Hymenoscyphus fraxineus TaxID=746836 RepID=A0A9N9PJ71_9HELO|nr:hypothetical protein HYFRA_00010310 [Hymenoscyphus fraxineus]
MYLTSIEVVGRVGEVVEALLGLIEVGGEEGGDRRSWRYWWLYLAQTGLERCYLYSPTMRESQCESVASSYRSDGIGISWAEGLQARLGRRTRSGRSQLSECLRHDDDEVRGHPGFWGDFQGFKPDQPLQNMERKHRIGPSMPLLAQPGPIGRWASTPLQLHAITIPTQGLRRTTVTCCRFSIRHNRIFNHVNTGEVERAAPLEAARRFTAVVEARRGEGEGHVRSPSVTRSQDFKVHIQRLPFSRAEKSEVRKFKKLSPKKSRSSTTTSERNQKEKVGASCVYQKLTSTAASTRAARPPAIIAPQSSFPLLHKENEKNKNESLQSRTALAKRPDEPITTDQEAVRLIISTHQKHYDLYINLPPDTLSKSLVLAGISTFPGFEAPFLSQAVVLVAHSTFVEAGECGLWRPQTRLDSCGWLDPEGFQK